ncbi:hypothetical protein DL89DRAFT_260825 [Linderina pennispora]|uniref:Uncharacterized protein n=1 Tax=Linderina pennispora TaxID=61395 RepID=A0A1Y1VWT0_9FUNG|nr:uncharacterized protein DL89DRAFT_260825 [Linderina pennispora]ORX65758.1 hypothetical protein DL89DRAFT_260825 [Linderina pennispora]
MASLRVHLNSLLGLELKNRDNMPDISDARYTSNGIEQQGFIQHSDIFMDSCVVEIPESYALIDQINNITPFDRLHRVFGDGYRFKYMKCMVSVRNGKVSVYKVSAPNVAIADPALTDIFLRMHQEHVFLLNYDITMDCLNISSRAVIKEFLFDNGISSNDILDDEDKVGANCISWFTDEDEIRIRNKLYNKFVQLLESGEVRNQLTSKLSELVMPTSQQFGETLVACRNEGLMRLELTVHSPELKEVEWNTNLIASTLEFLSDCRTFATSYEKQWMALVDQIHNKHTLCIYFHKEHALAYCHWFNRTTKKKQGIAKKLKENEDMMTVVSNLSFNGHPTLLLTYATSSGPLESEVVLRRDITNITIVPSQKNSFWPVVSRERQQHTFAEMGLVNYRGMHIDWLTAQQAREKVCLSTLSSVSEDTDDLGIDNLIADISNIELDDLEPTYIRENTDLRPARYKVAYNILHIGDEFLVSHYFLYTFRGLLFYYLDIYMIHNEVVSSTHTHIKIQASSPFGEYIASIIGEPSQEVVHKVTRIHNRIIHTERI